MSSQATNYARSMGRKEVDQQNSSNRDDTSSTSSCSCEDHIARTAVGSHYGDDLHGDLDYDDDEEEGIKISGTHNRRSTETVTDDLRTQSQVSSPINNKQKDARSELRKHKEGDPNEGESCDTHKSTKKITSFINFDHGNDEAEGGQIGPTQDTEKTSKDRSHKSYGALLKYFFKDACYFQIKSINHENVALSKSMGVWSTPLQNELRLNAAFREHRNVILIFSVQQSGAFQGFARMISESRPPREPVPWVLPERLSNAALGGVFRLEWLCTKELHFTETRDLYNAFNNNKPVKVARDGQQVEPKVGRKLCTLFPKDSKERLLASLDTLKTQHRQRKQILRQNSYYPLDEARVSGSVMNRLRNGLHSRLEFTTVNGFSGPNSTGQGRGAYHHFYAQPGPYSAGPYFDPMNRHAIFDQNSRHYTDWAINAPYRYHPYQRHYPRHYPGSPTLPKR